MPKITWKNTPEARKLHFPQQESLKFRFLEQFPVKFYDGEASFNSQKYFSQAEIRYESEGVLFDQIKISGKTHGDENTEM